MMRNLHQELETWDGTYSEAWRPKPGEILVAFIESYDVGYTSYGEVRTVIVAEEETGRKLTIWLTSTVLLNLFRRHKPKPGERIGLKYLGKHPEKGYHTYHLMVDRPVGLELTPLGGEEVEHPDETQEKNADVPF